MDPLKIYWSLLSSNSCPLIFPSSVITNTDEWGYFKALTKTLTPLEENMFHLEDGTAGPRVYLRPKESIHIPLKYQSFLCDHTMSPQVQWRAEVGADGPVRTDHLLKVPFDAHLQVHTCVLGVYNFFLHNLKQYFSGTVRFSGASIHSLSQRPILMPFSLRPSSLKAWFSPIGQFKQVWASTTHHVSPSAVPLFLQLQLCWMRGWGWWFKVMTSQPCRSPDSWIIAVCISLLSVLMVFIQHLDQLDTNISNFCNIVPLKPHFRMAVIYFLVYINVSRCVMETLDLQLIGCRKDSSK